LHDVKWTAIFFTVAFGASFVMHILQAGFSRRWFLFYSFVLAAGLEAGGWGARLASAESIAWIFNYGGLWDSDNNAFMAQSVHQLVVSCIVPPTDLPPPTGLWP
jgi:hypothetical protein